MMSAGKQQVLSVPGARRTSLTSPTGILTTTTVLVSQGKNGAYILSHLPRYHGIPILAISLLDLANSADFPANVFNQIPVPHFAMALMAIGATFALVMSVIAFVDASRSWENIKLLREERSELLARIGGGGGGNWKGRGKDGGNKSAAGSEAISEGGESEDEKQAERLVVDPAMISLNKRDLRVEFFERVGMETVMGSAAFLVSVGTYMAIGGDNHKVFMASNLLSGYIGNAPTALYGLINTGWSCVAFHRARRQRKSALAGLPAGAVREAVKKRTSSIERHAILSGITCLVSGALGLLTPTHWEPYPVLLVCGLLFIYTTYVFRTGVAYIRPKLSVNNAQPHLVANDIRDEIEHLLSIQTNAAKEKVFLSKASFGHILEGSFPAILGPVVRLGLFDKFCERVLDDAQLNTRLYGEWGNIGKLSYRDFLTLDQELHPTLDDHARFVLMKYGAHRVDIQIRFLLEVLGTCLITSPSEPVTEKAPV